MKEGKDMAEKQKPVKKEKFEKVISGTATVRKKSGVRKFTDIFLAEDIRDVKSYIFEDVVVPNIKNFIGDLIQETVNKLFFGGSRRTTDRSVGFRADRVSYDRFSKPDTYRNDRYSSKSEYSYDDIVLKSRGDAESVLDRMCEAIREYGMVSVADLYEFVGLPDQFTDHKYGWTSMHNAKIIRLRDGYTIDLPKPFPLD